MADAQVQPFTYPAPQGMAPGYHNELVRVLEQLYQETFWVNTEATADLTSSSTLTTPIRREHIFCTSSSAITITLNDGSAGNHPFEDQEVMITAHGTGAVTVDFGNKTCQGVGSTTLSLYDTPCFKWSDIVDEWVVSA